MYDLVIIGAGFAGVSASIEADRLGLNYVCLEKYKIGATFLKYGTNTTLYSTGSEIRLRPTDLPDGQRLTGEEVAGYLGRVVEDLKLNVQHPFTVTSIKGNINVGFTVQIGYQQIETKAVLFCGGGFSAPKKMPEGETLSSWLDVPLEACYVLVVGDGNSAAESALKLHAVGKDVTWTFRGDRLSSPPSGGEGLHVQRIIPKIEGIRSERFRVWLSSEVVAVNGNSVRIRRPGHPNSEQESPDTFPFDAVVACLGYEADLSLLEEAGVNVESECVEYNSALETNVPGIFVAGHFTTKKHIAAAIRTGREAVHSIARKLGINVEA